MVSNTSAFPIIIHASLSSDVGDGQMYARLTPPPALLKTVNLAPAGNSGATRYINLAITSEQIRAFVSSLIVAPETYETA